ncbi:uncharacterized protein LOC126969201 [Leptidea sinapis]|uniref:uncharacterized protein LOC126969201 n=1 Tax=Leptidea sinapis TaxID=189913 RepID=UPI0021466AE1|nr:uncharacterized protein LOC126969201 [Leptidea sinapis]
MWWRILACTLLLASLIRGENTTIIKETSLAVTACIPGGEDVAPALAELGALIMRTAGVKAHAVPPPAECWSPYRADTEMCRIATIRQLIEAKINVVFLSLPTANLLPTNSLHDFGLDDLGDISVPTRRVCLAAPPARSILDFADSTIATKYHVSMAEIVGSFTNDNKSNDSILLPEKFTSLKPEWCNSTECAIIFTSDESEGLLLFEIVLTYKLYSIVVPLGAEVYRIATSFGNRALLCDWAPKYKDLAKNLFPLGPPPCIDSDADRCYFESRRLVKLINTRALARSPAAVRALIRLNLKVSEIHELAERKRIKGAQDAALEFLSAHPIRNVHLEVRVAVLIPKTTKKEVYDASALAAAAALAEADLEKESVGIARFKVETYDDHCDAARAYQYMIDALGTGEYSMLSAVVGPACGSAFADVARQGPTHGLPVLAYTAQVPTSPAAPFALLAAGDARLAASALAALMSHLGWRRVAAVTEPATRSALSTASLGVDFIVPLDLPEDRTDLEPDIFSSWAERVVRKNARIILVYVEDARAVRSVLCAGYNASLTPDSGAVWMLPATLPPNWHKPGPYDKCSAEQLEQMILGHISVASEWLINWSSERSLNTSLSNQTTAWESRWKQQCNFLKVQCVDPGPHAMLLYDTVTLWANTLKQLINERPTAMDDLHDTRLIRSLVMNATLTNYVGLTGQFNWTRLGTDSEDAAYARKSPLILYQWDGHRRNVIGKWLDNTLDVQDHLIKWYTSDGHMPDDGGEICGIQPLADFLSTDCRAAFFLLLSMLLALTVAAITGLAYYCKRRAERKYRVRLEALRLRSLPKTIGLDKWEIPRERVVINRKLGMGAFGTVYGGHALIAEDRGWTAVAVKTLKAGANTEEKLDFLSEAEAMKRFDHKNVVRLLGVITKTEPVCTVMEFMLYGDLKNYLLARRHLAMADTSDDPEEQVSARRLTGMALDVARALSYLAQLKYVHRDVAARNCLVSARRVVKLADFGMTRLVFENDYYRFSRKGMLPVRWMAPESLAYGVFSPASDVWSFGVLLYEIVTFGALPFQGLSNSEVLTKVKDGETLALPAGLKPQLEGLIKSCWKTSYKARPTASDVAAFLADSPRLLTPCLDIPLDSLPLDADSIWRMPKDRAEARWVSWAAPASTATDTTYLSTDGVRENDRFLP